MKILAVDDDPVAGMLLEGTLRKLGHEVTLETSGRAAYAAMRTNDFRVIVSDWRMEHGDGLELCRRVRERAGEYVYFILVSQESDSDEHYEAAMEAGVDDFLVKPVRVRSLRMRLRTAERFIAVTRQVTELESFLPICSYCKSVRGDDDYWQRVEIYLEKQSGTRMSHGICPDCYNTHMLPQLRAFGVEVEAKPTDRRADHVD